MRSQLIRTRLWLAWACCAWLQAAQASDFTRSITINVYDYAIVEPAQLAEAETVALRLFEKAGIGGRWRHCATPTNGVKPDSDCRENESAATLFIRILPESMSREISRGTQQFGTSISTRDGVFPKDAYIFFQRVRNQAEEDRTPCSLLVGAVIAHEVGHLLLGDNSHAPSGIMCGKWRRQEIKRIFIGDLAFSPREAERMRAEVDRRIAIRQEKTEGPICFQTGPRTTTVSAPDG